MFWYLGALLFKIPLLFVGHPGAITLRSVEGFHFREAFMLKLDASALARSVQDLSAWRQKNPFWGRHRWFFSADSAKFAPKP
jgi:hypothetical protein